MGWISHKPTQQKQVEAALQVASNLYEHTKPGAANAPAPLHFSLPDSRYKYLMFCLSTMELACAPKMKNPDAVVNECLHFLVTWTTTECVQEFFGGPVDAQDAANRGAAYVQEFLHNWSTYLDIVKGGNSPCATDFVCSMIRTAESNEPASQGDAHRLGQLALWVENSIPAMRDAFMELASR
jgi:hypothetical protein